MHVWHVRVPPMQCITSLAWKKHQRHFDPNTEPLQIDILLSAQLKGYHETPNLRALARLISNLTKRKATDKTINKIAISIPPRRPLSTYIHIAAGEGDDETPPHPRQATSMNLEKSPSTRVAVRQSNGSSRSLGPSDLRSDDPGSPEHQRKNGIVVWKRWKLESVIV